MFDLQLIQCPISTQCGVVSVVERSDDVSRGPSDKGVGGNIFGDHRPCRHNRIPTHRYTADYPRAGCNPDASLDHDGLGHNVRAPCRWHDGVARRDNARVRSNHNIITDTDPGKIVERAVLIYEHMSTDMDFPAASYEEGWSQAEAIIDLSAGQLTEQSQDFIDVIERQAIECGVILIALLVSANMASASDVPM